MPKPIKDKTANPQPELTPLLEPKEGSQPEANQKPELGRVQMRKRLKQARRVVQRVVEVVLRGLTSALCSVVIEGAFDL
jgi:hypothetical protein